MKKFFVIFLIFSLILSTALIKNSTKKIDDNIFILEENLRSYKKELENIKLENEYLSSTEKLLEFQNLFFDEELVKKNIEEIKIIYKRKNNLKIEKLEFID